MPNKCVAAFTRRKCRRGKDKSARHEGHCRSQKKAKAPATVRGRYTEGPRGRKYWVPLTGSWRRRRSCWRSALRSTKSISEVLITRRSEAAERKKIFEGFGDVGASLEGRGRRK